MTEVSLEILNRRTAIAAVHAEATRSGLDGDRLLDSKTFHDRVVALDPDEPGFHTRVREIVASAAGARQPVPDAAPAQGASGAQRQWTDEDVARLPSTREGAVQLQAAIDAGLLRDLGYPPRRR
jgi:hypothetical protein